MANVTILHGSVDKIVPAVGCYVTLDGRPGYPGSNGTRLVDGADFPAVVGYAGADFGLPSYALGHAMGVNVKVTGRTVQRKWDMDLVRVVVEFVGDGEPSEFLKGWMTVS